MMDFDDIDKSTFECLKFEDGSIYFGQTAWIDEHGKVVHEQGKKKVRHGKGAQIFFTTDQSVLCKYEGDWVADRKEGVGMASYPDGSTYNGSLKADLKDGYGNFVWPNGSEYIGNWRDDRIEGHGTFKHYEVALVSD